MSKENYDNVKILNYYNIIRNTFYLFILIFNVVIAQNTQPSFHLSTDQLLQNYRSLKNPSQESILSSSSDDRKCTFGIHAQIHSRWNEFSSSQQMELRKLMQGDTSKQCHVIIGHFRISYDTSTADTPRLLGVPGPTWNAYVDSVGRIFNHVWDVEITRMGYQPPRFQSGQSYYNIYIQNLTAYGGTQFDPPPVIGQTCESFIEIDNDYQGFYSPGIEGLKVTAAHEFQHAIQLGAYGYWGAENIYAYELTSTWFEDVVYPDVKDYFQYLHNYFEGMSVGLSFNTGSYGGYERCIWAHYLAKKFGPDVIREIWAQWTQSFIVSVDTVLKKPAYGSNLESAFAEFNYWNYFTGDRADTAQYYPEGNHYPRFKPLQSVPFNGSTTTVTGEVYPLSSSMYEFVEHGNVITAILANVDVEHAKLYSTILQKADVTLSSSALISPYQTLSNGLKIKTEVDFPSLWRTFYSLSLLHPEVSPNIFLPASATRLILPISEYKANSAVVYFFSSSLSLVCSIPANTEYAFGNRAIIIPASEIRSKLSSGIYFVIAKTPDNEFRWKLAVVR